MRDREWVRPPAQTNGWGWQTETRLEAVETAQVSHTRQLASLADLIRWARLISVALAASGLGYLVRLDAAQYGQAASQAARLVLALLK